MLDFLGDVADTVLDAANGVGDSIGSAIMSALSDFFGKVAYYATIAFLFILKLIYQVFEVFAGLVKVRYDDTHDYLINIFASNSTISNIYWAMVLIGIAMVFGFAILAVARKIFDIDGKQQHSMGNILFSSAKSIFIMLVLSFVVTATINVGNVLIQSMSYIFDNGADLDKEESIVFTEEELATMGRIYSTIGNYAINPSSTSRFNINACFNAIRPDLQYLQRLGVFDFQYITKDKNGNTVNTWQSCLQDIVNSASLSRDLPMDVYNESVTNSITGVMDVMRKDASFAPLQSYEREYRVQNGTELDTILFLSGTMGAALNDQYNKTLSMLDGARGPFYSGTKDIYSLDDVMDVFNIGLFGGINYLMILLLAYFTMRSLIRCIFGCIARIVNLMALYIVAPPFIATMPLDDGQKFNQWIISFVVQAFGVFGTIIPMRLVIVFVPIIMDPKLVLMENTLLNFGCKVLMVVASLLACEQFSGIITGILANNASMAAVNAGNLNGAADKMFGGIMSGVKGAAKFGADMSGMTALGGKIKDAASSVYGGIRDGGGIGISAARGIGAMFSSGDKKDADSKDSGPGGDSGGDAPDTSGVGGEQDTGPDGDAPDVSGIGGEQDGGPDGQNMSDMGEQDGGPDGYTPAENMGTVDEFLGNDSGPDGGGEKNYSPKVQSLFGVDAQGNPKSQSEQDTGSGGGEKNYSPKVQSLFGVDAQGKPMSQREQELSSIRSGLKHVETRGDSASGTAAHQQQARQAELDNARGGLKHVETRGDSASGTAAHQQQARQAELDSIRGGLKHVNTKGDSASGTAVHQQAARQGELDAVRGGLKHVNTKGDSASNMKITPRPVPQQAPRANTPKTSQQAPQQNMSSMGTQGGGAGMQTPGTSNVGGESDSGGGDSSYQQRREQELNSIRSNLSHVETRGDSASGTAAHQQAARQAELDAVRGGLKHTDTQGDSASSIKITPRSVPQQAPQMSTPNMSQQAPKMSTPNVPQQAPKMSTPNMSQQAPKMSTPNISQPAPQMSTPNVSQPAPQMSTPNVPQQAPKMSTPNISQPAPQMSTPNVSQPAPQMNIPKAPEPASQHSQLPFTKVKPGEDPLSNPPKKK